MLEHRWGERYRVDVPLAVRVGNELLPARLKNMSLSGALMRLEHPMARLARLEVLLNLPGQEDGPEFAIQAFVTRRHHQRHMVAVEWCTFAPTGVSIYLRQVMRASTPSVGLRPVPIRHPHDRLDMQQGNQPKRPY